MVAVGPVLAVTCCKALAVADVLLDGYINAVVVERTHLHHAGDKLQLVKAFAGLALFGHAAELVHHLVLTIAGIEDVTCLEVQFLALVLPTLHVHIDHGAHGTLGHDVCLSPVERFDLHHAGVGNLGTRRGLAVVGVVLRVVPSAQGAEAGGLSYDDVVLAIVVEGSRIANLGGVPHAAVEFQLGHALAIEVGTVSAVEIDAVAHQFVLEAESVGIDVAVMDVLDFRDGVYLVVLLAQVDGASLLHHAQTHVGEDAALISVGRQRFLAESEFQGLRGLGVKIDHEAQFVVGSVTVQVIELRRYLYALGTHGDALELFQVGQFDADGCVLHRLVVRVAYLNGHDALFADGIDLCLCRAGHVCHFVMLLCPGYCGKKAGSKQNASFHNNVLVVFYSIVFNSPLTLRSETLTFSTYSLVKGSRPWGRKSCTWSMVMSLLSLISMP